MMEKDSLSSSITSGGFSFEEALRIIQLTDPHIFAERSGLFDGVNTLASLEAVIALAQRSHWPADLVVLTGDLVHEPDPQAYRLLHQCLTQLAVPVYCIPGNHDDPEIMRQCLSSKNVHMTRNVFIRDWQLIFLNTQVPGSEKGHLSEAELEALDSCLETHRDKWALVCLHHHPVPIGSPWMDAMALDNPEALFEVVDRFDRIRGIVWGHIHQEFSTLRKGVWLLGAPSTCVQFAPGSDRYLKDVRRGGYRWLVLEPNGRLHTGVRYLQ